MYACSVWCLIVTLLLLAAPPAGLATDGVPLDDLLEGFDNEKPGSTPVPPPEQVSEPSHWYLAGAASLRFAFNTAHAAPVAGQVDHRNLSSARGKLSLQLAGQFSRRWRARVEGYTFYDAAYDRAAHNYPEVLVDTMRAETEFGEAYLAGSLGPVDLKLGRQVLAWGKADTLSVVDLVSPLDLREPGMADIDDLRLPLTMARLDYYPDRTWRISALAIPEIRVNEFPAYGSDFFPFPMPLTDEVPDHGGGNTEWAAAVEGTFSGWDLGFYWADLVDNMPYPVLTLQGQNLLPTSLAHARIQLAGVALDLASGNWLLKGELAQVRGARQTSQLASDRRHLVGVIEYSGVADVVMALELAWQSLLDYSVRHGQAGYDKDSWQSVIRLSLDQLHDTLHWTVLYSGYGGSGGFTRGQVQYDIADAFTLSGGVVLYRGGDSLMTRGIGDNDRVFLQARYSF